MARRLLSQLDMGQSIVTFLGLLGLLVLVLLGSKLSTDLDFSLRRNHTARDQDRDQDQDQDQASAAAARRRALHLTDPRCARP